MDHAELTTEQVLKRDIPWETYMMTKLITGTSLQLLRRYDNRSISYRATLLDDIAQFRGKIGRFGDLTAQTAVGIMNPGFFLNPRFQYHEGFESSDHIRSRVMKVIERLAPDVTFAIEATREDGPAYVRVFVNILRDILKEETVEYVLALTDEMLTANPKRSRLFHDKSLASEDTYEPFLISPIPRKDWALRRSHDTDSGRDYESRMLRKSNWFIQEKSCKILALIVSARPKIQADIIENGVASNSKKRFTTMDDVLKGLVEWLCDQLKKPSHPTRGIPTAISCLATLLREPLVRSSFVNADGVKLLVPLISPASTQQSIQVLYETCLCIWLLSYYDPAVEYLSTAQTVPRLVEVAKNSTKEKVVRVVVLTLKNLLPKGAFGAQMVDIGLPQVVQSLKAQAWNDEDLLDALNQLEEGLKDNIKKLSSFDKYKQEVLLGHLDWSPMHKDPLFWRENITHFEESDFQILRVLITILDTSSDPQALSIACYDLSQFIQYHPAGRGVASDLNAKERVMMLMNHENSEVTKNALLCIQRLFLGAKYASFLQS